MTIEHISIRKLKLNPDNPRGLKKTEFASLVKSLQDCPEMFEARPLLVSDRTGELVVIGGNMRLRAAKKLEYKDVPCIVMQGLTPEKEREIVIKDNGAWGEWDYEALANGWDDCPLQDWGLDLKLTSEKDGKVDYSELIDPTGDRKTDQAAGMPTKIVKCPECGHEFEVKLAQRNL